MLDTLLGIIDYLNQDNEVEAAKRLIEATRYIEDENLMKIVGEIEKEIHDIKNTGLSEEMTGELAQELERIEDELKALKRRKLKILVIYAIDRMSNGNSVVLQMIRRPTYVRKPQTFM
ncbi:MAG: hypothetical protein RXS23_03970 [Metallosphaera yellowstonensis]|jgi:uncharacterized radical SAM superfamily Fe-S cluster-containing enzyme|uniref:Uncharacterized protein n=1 Tax=Metallosphaera yellowstonensis MK1 TaxID=671065 RepID=H2C801_9CREN|nr:hypothetical protein [Metallosphaera yellowstonensis]EHP68277.1 hypothetical protein MetMK1DRAFT_00027010 [Metallosphaera yellowstonensis MK1]